MSTNAFLHWSVPDPAPTIGRIEAKYGKPNRQTQIQNQEFTDNKKRDASVYWYGRFGFVVAQGNVEGTVQWVAFE